MANSVRGTEIDEVGQLLRETRIEVAPATYFLVGLRYEEWTRLLEQPELAPRGDVPFMVLRDAHEVTLLVEETDWRTMRHALRDARVEPGFRLLTLDRELKWDVVGYLARVTDALARAGVPVGVLSSFSRDHLLVKQEDLPRTLRTLGEYVAGLC